MSSELAVPDDAGAAEEAPRRYPQLRFIMPPGATEIVLVRHGESMPVDPARPFPLLDGRGDPELAPGGRAQAVLIAERLAKSEVHAIYVTPLRRTAETAEPLASRLGLVPVVEAGLVEVHLGEWGDGSYRQKVSERDPLAIEMISKERWDVIPGAESNEEVRARVEDAIERIAARHRDQRVVAFAHGGSIGAVLARAAGSRPFAFVGSDNGAISRLVVDRDRWLIRSFNDRSHLD